MSNLNDEGQRYDPRMRNGWAEYQRLVLAELERHNQLIDTQNTKLNDISLQIALLKQENGKFGKIETRLDQVEKDTSNFRQGTLIDDAVTKYRTWLLSGGFLLITAVAIPLIKIFIGVG